MANETKPIYEQSVPIPFTVNNTDAVEKGDFLLLRDLMSVSAHGAVVSDSQSSADNARVAGIAKNEKIASDGIKKIAVYMDGIHRVTASGAIAEGDPVYLSNTENAVASASGSRAGTTWNMAGIAMETAADGETLLFKLQPHVLHTSGTFIVSGGGL